LFCDDRVNLAVVRAVSLKDRRANSVEECWRNKQKIDE